MTSSFGFPKMFNHTTSNIVTEKEAIRKNILSLLSCERGSLFGDPYYGCQLRRYIFEQPTSIVVDLLIDEIYTAITTFIPQVYISRNDITIFAVRNTVYVELSYYLRLDNTSDLFTIKLTETESEE